MNRIAGATTCEDAALLGPSRLVSVRGGNCFDVVALVTLLVVVLSSLILTRIATKILTLTGLAAENARFQARSALTGVGFTTSEAESVVNHPVRRRVVVALMWSAAAPASSP